MNLPTSPLWCVLIGFAMINAAASAAPKTITEFDSNNSKSPDWRVVNDGVMGGLSKGKLSISKDGVLTFKGNLSLKNNGGFSSIRTERVPMDLSNADGVVLRVKGDGRTYQMRFNTNARFRGMEVSFKADFDTRQGEWTEVKVPFNQFEGSFRGMSLKKEKFDPAEIRRVGLLLADKKSGPFELQVDWIRPYGSEATNTTAAQDVDLISAAVADGRFTVLAKALTATDLVAALQADGPFTVFAPTDEAFAKLPEGTLESLLAEEGQKKLKSILTYHVVSGSTDLVSAISAGQAKTLQGSTVEVVFTNGRVKVNDANLVNADIKCSNGIIHVIDSVILPPEPSNRIVDVAKRSGKFTTLLAALDAAKLTKALSGEDEFTILAPTDDAFAALPKGTIESLLKPENLSKLQSILSLHAIPEVVSAGDALNAKKVETLSGGALEFVVNNGLFQVNGVTIVKTDIICDNGIIHVIDAVLLPGALDKNQDAATNPKAAIQQIEDAISRGVPIFNNGEHGECARIYRDCMISMIDGNKVAPDVAGVMREYADKATKIEDDAKRAWMLRRGLDHVYAGLSH